MTKKKEEEKEEKKTRINSPIEFRFEHLSTETKL